MNIKLKRIKLTEMDRKIIQKNSSICTDSHGKGCSITYMNEKNKNLN